MADESATSSEVSPAFLEALYGDPLREETARAGRYLIIASAICMAAVLFKVRLQSTSLVPIDFGSRADVLAMLLALAVLLLFCSFAMRAATDVFRDREVSILVVRYIESERVKAALVAARAVESQIMEDQDEDGYHDPDPWWDSYSEVKEAAEKAVTKAENRIGMRKLPQKVRTIRVSLEVGVPVLFGAMTLFLSRASLLDFASALLLAF